jgi:murein DD-endopeptidase MepM/ murein hydrolase activator NlpD
MKYKTIAQIFVLFAMLLSISAEKVDALGAAAVPPSDMFQLPWEQGLSWVAYSGFDNGNRRPNTSPHNYRMGGAIDFAPHANMVVGEDTSNFWVTAAANGVVTTVSSCHIVIDHGNGWTTEYWHLANIQVSKNDVVSRNQRIAVIADNILFQVCTGNEHPGPHLHFVMRSNMEDTRFAGWRINYDEGTNKTTFTKSGKTVGLFVPLLNVMPVAGTATMTRTITATRTITPTITPTVTRTPTQTITSTPTSTFTATSTSTSVVTNTPSITNTPTITNTPVITDTSVFTNTPVTNTATATSTVVSTDTPTVTATSPIVITNTPIVQTATSTITNTPVITNTFVFTNTPTSTPSNTSTVTATSLPTGPYILTDSAQSDLLVGATSLVTVSLNNVPPEGYVSAEITCTYNAALLNVNNIAVAGLFGPNPVVAINRPQNGSFIFALVATGGNKATTNGTVLTFSATALQAGQSPVACTANVSRGSSIYETIAFVGDTINVLPGTATPTVTATIPPATLAPTLLAGQVIASKPVTIRLYNLDSTLAATIPANPDGTFSFPFATGSYTVVASAEGFLNAQGPVTLTSGSTTTKPTINLIPGDVDGNSVINQLDALTIGMNYNGSTPTAADLNNDGVINVLDLQMLAAHYGQSGALAW